MRVYLICMFLFSSSALWSQTLSEPPNLGQLKTIIRHYVDSGVYFSDIGQVYEKVREFVNIQMANPANQGKKLAIVMDIDETTLSNMIYEKRYGFGYSRVTWKSWVAEEKATAIPAAKAFYDWGRSKGLTFFFVTGRKQNTDSMETDSTVRNMRAEGFSMYGKIYLKPDIKGIDTVVYKSGARREITEQGYMILANIGDQPSDLEGGYALSSWKIPNPMYHVN